MAVEIIKKWNLKSTSINFSFLGYFKDLLSGLNFYVVQKT